MMPPSIVLGLCPECRSGPYPCPRGETIDAAGGGVSCRAYVPRPSRKADRITAAQAAALPDREPCADCACRKGSTPNGTHHTMADFEAAVREGEPFLCHAEGTGRICAGWLRAFLARKETAE